MDVEIILDDLGIEYYATDERYMVCCPFHNDTNPSCGIWAESGYFKCFACGEEGNLVEFMVEVGEMSKGEAIRKVRGHDSVSDMEEGMYRFLDRNEKKLKYFKWSSFCETYPEVVPETDVWDYLTREGGEPKGRKLTGESIERFQARWGGEHGKYHHRVVLPIRTVEGKLLSYVGRAIKKGMVPKTRKARSPHRTFFGLYELVDKSGKLPLLIVVEGEFDAIYLQQHGVPAVANMGTSPMGGEKKVLLKRYASKVVLSYDGDEAGQKAMYGDEKRRGELRVLEEHMPTASVHLPDGLDPNGLTPEQVEEFYGEYRTHGT